MVCERLPQTVLDMMKMKGITLSGCTPFHVGKAESRRILRKGQTIVVKELRCIRGKLYELEGEFVEQPKCGTLRPHRFSLNGLPQNAKVAVAVTDLL